MKPSKLRTIVLSVVFASLCYTAHAAPAISSVSGTFGKGQTIRISGSGFGSKSPAAPYIWADFENGSNPSSLGQKTNWDGVQSLSWSTEGYAGSHGMKASDGNGDWALRSDYSSWTSENQHVYIFKKQKANFLVTSDTQNWKIWRMWPPNSQGNYPDLYIAAHNGRAYVEDIGTESGYWGNFRTTSTNWTTEEIIFRASSAINLKDGLLTYRLDGQQLSSGSVLTRSSAAPAYMSQNYVVHQVLANAGMWSPAWSSNNRVWVDDVYVDTTWSRVMLGDAATFSSCRTLDIQIPQAWSDTGVTLVGNTDSFASGARAYVYVFDKDNNVNAAGYPVTIGQGSTVSNTAPSVNAGAAATVTVGAPLSLSGTVTDDGLPNPPGHTTVAWSSISGPAAPTISEPTLLSTDVRFPVAGVYVLQLTANDGALSASATKTVTVTPATGNVAPIVNAGSNLTVTLPATANLAGSATDDGLPAGSSLSYAWTVISGPGTVGFGNINAPVTWASFSDPGTYVLQLTASDSALSSSAQVTVTVQPVAVSNSGTPTVASVTGRLTIGGQLTINGNSFGTKNPAAPYVWADFENGIQPSSLGQKRSWDEVQNFAWSTEGYGGSHGVKADDGSGTWTLRADFNDWTADGQKAYMFKKEKQNFVITSTSQNWKIWRMWPASQAYPDVYAASNNGRVYVENIGTESGFWGDFKQNTTDWSTVETIFQASSGPGVKDGLYVLRYDGVEKARGSLITRSSAAPATMQWNYVVHGVAANKGGWSPAWNDNNRMWADDVYVDTTWSRVMLGESPTYAACNQLEVQIPSAWSNNSITVWARPGRFTKGQHVYLYVFDSNGNVNADGYPVMVDQSGIGSLVNGGDPGEAGIDEPVHNVFNPARGENAALSYVLKQPGSVRMTIYDRGGHKIKELNGDERLEGAHTIAWDGRNDEGSLVASGIYIAISKGSDGSHGRQKVAVIK